MKILSAASMRKLDRYTINMLGVPSIDLMERASEHIAEAAAEHIRTNGCAAVFCGPGNNGGDGVGAAVSLLRRGVQVRTFLVGSREKMTQDTQTMEQRLNKAGGVLEQYVPSGGAEEYVYGCDVVIDAMFGIGLNTDLRGDALSAAQLINDTDAFVIAADIPSGVHADTGRVLGDSVCADMTVTFSAAKAGQFTEPGCVLCGQIRVCDIGIPSEIVQAEEPFAEAVIEGEISLPRRRPDSYKGDYGRDLIVAGSTGYTGAPVLAGGAASRMGAGLVYLGVPKEIYEITAVKCSEIMPFPLSCDADGVVDRFAYDVVIKKLSQCSVCLVGPGLGRSEGVTRLVEDILKNSHVPVILDADGINAISGNIDILDEASCPVILTPHEGEFRRIYGEIGEEGRLEAARSFAKRHGCVLVLKGHRTITALPDGSVAINTTGGPALAKGGSGDVLAGMTAALVGQRFPIKDAAVAAVYLHGLAGDIAAEELGEYSVTAEDVIQSISRAVKKCVAK